MSDPELLLKRLRAELWKRIGVLGDQRRGSIAATSGNCENQPATSPNREASAMDRVSG
jgi:hypothetical protein